MNHRAHIPMNHKAHQEHKDRLHEPIDAEVEHIVRVVIGAGIAVHRELGPGFIEPVYGRALCVELRHREFNVEEQKSILIQYRGEPVCRHRLDLLVENAVVVEVKAVRRLKRIHQAQILSYLKASGCRVGLLMNFNVTVFVKGLRRFVR
jgi:GxxExxY protein